MSLFGSYRDDRRRRSLAEDSAGETIAVASELTPKPSARPQRYHSAARAKIIGLRPISYRAAAGPCRCFISPA